MKVVLLGHQPGGTLQSLLWAGGARGGWLRNLTRYCPGSLPVSVPCSYPILSLSCPLSNLVPFLLGSVHCLCLSFLCLPPHWEKWLKSKN